MNNGFIAILSSCNNGKSNATKIREYCNEITETKEVYRLYLGRLGYFESNSLIVEQSDWVITPG